MTATIGVLCDARLKAVLGQKADEERLPLNEYCARILAEHIGRPDLAPIPRKTRVGRPRKQLPLPSPV
jgi:hypothetical protein